MNYGWFMSFAIRKNQYLAFNSMVTNEHPFLAIEKIKRRYDQGGEFEVTMVSFQKLTIDDIPEVRKDG